MRPQVLSQRDVGFTGYVRQADNLDPTRKIVYSERKHFGEGTFYKIEISFCENHLHVAAFDVNTPESLLIEIKPEKVQFILEHFNKDYDLMARCLQVEKKTKRLILIKPSEAINVINDPKRVGTAPAGTNPRQKIRNAQAHSHLNNDSTANYTNNDLKSQEPTPYVDSQTNQPISIQDSNEPTKEIQHE